MKNKLNSLKYFVLGLGLIGVSLTTNAQIEHATKSKLINQQSINSPQSKVMIQHSLLLQSPNNHSPVVNIDGAHCATDILMNAYLESSGLKAQYEAEYQQMVDNINYNSTERATYTIPVIFHIVYNTNAQNISTASITTMFNELNQDYQLQNADRANARSQYGFTPANVNVSFCLAVRDPQNNPLTEPGIQRVHTTETYFDPNTESNDMKYTSSGGTNSWDRSHYLNVWICNISNGANSGVAGYSYSPTVTQLPPAAIDGIVIDYHLGFPPSHHVLGHEVGHYLGLAHTWGNSNQGTNCTDDDGISDTPNTKGPSFNYPGSCSGNQVTCTVQTQYENFMDYSNCTCMFTAGQVSLMHQILANSRISLQSSIACTSLNTNPPSTDFVADITTVVSGGTVNFTDLSTNYPTSWSWTITPSTGWSYTGGTSSTIQNPMVQFNAIGTYTVKLTASNTNGPDTETKTNYITVIASGGGTTACDTLRNWTPTDVMTYYSITNTTDQSWGFLPGTASIDLSQNSDGSLMVNALNYAETFTASTSSQIRAIRIAFAKVKNRSGNASVNFIVYSNNAGKPGTTLATKNVSFDDLDEGYWNTIEFSSPVTVSGQFWVGYSLNYGNPQDTLVAITTSDRGASGNGTTYFYLDHTQLGWKSLVEIYGMHTSIYMDALLSNGPAPVASLSITNTVTCKDSPVSMNGYGSTNTNHYLWTFDNGTNQYYSTDGALTYNFNQGTWAIELHAQGSCTEDVATTTLTVNPAITPNTNITPEHCSAADGSITISPTGGNGGPYSVSSNSGATYINNAPYTFNNLTAGTYTTILTDGTGCADTISLIVTDNNSFNPTVSPGTAVTITAGDQVTLSVNGGTTWTWYEGTFVIGTTQSIDVSPATTTTYKVEITDANGCSKAIDITVTVEPITGIEESNLSNLIKIYPNPSKGVFNLSIVLGEAQNLNIKVYDLIGNLVKEMNYKNTNSAIYAIDLSGKDSGTYLVRITGNSGSTTKRIVLTK